MINTLQTYSVFFNWTLSKTEFIGSFGQFGMGLDKGFSNNYY